MNDQLRKKSWIICPNSIAPSIFKNNLKPSEKLREQNNFHIRMCFFLFTAVKFSVRKFLATLYINNWLNCYSKLVFFQLPNYSQKDIWMYFSRIRSNFVLLIIRFYYISKTIAVGFYHIYITYSISLCNVIKNDITNVSFRYQIATVHNQPTTVKA